MNDKRDLSLLSKEQIRNFGDVLDYIVRSKNSGIGYLDGVEIEVKINRRNENE